MQFIFALCCRKKRGGGGGALVARAMGYHGGYNVSTVLNLELRLHILFNSASKLSVYLEMH